MQLFFYLGVFTLGSVQLVVNIGSTLHLTNSLHSSRMQAGPVDARRIHHHGERARVVIVALLFLYLLSGEVGGERRVWGEARFKVSRRHCFCGCDSPLYA